MTKTYRQFFNECVLPSINEGKKEVDIQKYIKKVKKELEGNPYVDSIISDLLKKAKVKDISERQMRDDPNGFFIKTMIRFWDGIKKDFDELMKAESKKRKGVLMAKLATKACVVAIFVGVAIEELKSMAAGNVQKEINIEKLHSEIKSIDSKVEEYRK